MQVVILWRLSAIILDSCPRFRYDCFAEEYPDEFSICGCRKFRRPELDEIQSDACFR